MTSVKIGCARRMQTMGFVAKKFPINPAHPERNCWGCDKFCAASSLACGNGSERTQHPAELFGPDWDTWIAPAEPPPADLAADALQPG